MNVDLVTPRVAKTIKLFIGGAFPRTESGRSFAVQKFGKEEIYANLCLASRKDLRNAVEAALSAQPGWMDRTAYLRSQILYRAAEMMETKRAEFEEVFKSTLGMDTEHARKEVNGGIEALVYYAGFCDKYQQVTASLNPVAGPHHCFTFPEAIGVVGLLGSDRFDFRATLSQLVAPLVSGNTVVMVLSEHCPALIAPLAEVFATSDLPAGVVNLLTGSHEELWQVLASHMEVRAIGLDGESSDHFGEVQAEAVANMKRVVSVEKGLHLQAITHFVEFKTT